MPTMKAATLTEADQRALILALNQLGQLSHWDDEILREEVEFLMELDFDLEPLGFETGDIDLLFKVPGGTAEDDVELPPEDEPIISQKGDLWSIGKHMLLCGDARSADAYVRLMRGERAQMSFTDPPYNVLIPGNAAGIRRKKKPHREFVMGSGEMTGPEFEAFLLASLTRIAEVSLPGAIIDVCIDWRHTAELNRAAEALALEKKNLCVWVKTNAGMGSFYRSQHELVHILKVRGAEHINNFGLGGKGRNRTNVWSYAGANCFRKGRSEDLTNHPTVKPVAMVADAILDCSHRGGVILDPFAGSGTTLVAAERTGRRGYGMELDPAYVDVALRRLEKETGEEAVLENGETFAEVRAQRTFVDGAAA